MTVAYKTRRQRADDRPIFLVQHGALSDVDMAKLRDMPPYSVIEVPRFQSIQIVHARPRKRIAWVSLPIMRAR